MTWWYVNRSAGLVSWALLSASTIFGLLLSSKALGRRIKPNWLQDFHRGLSGLAVVFVAVHIAGAVGDNFVHFGWPEVFVPFTSTWRPWAVSWGVVTLYLLIAVEATSLLRKHLPKSLWRKVHYLSFPLFATATAHGITAGTEMGEPAGVIVAALMTAVVAGLTALRVIVDIEKAADDTPAEVPPTAAPMAVDDLPLPYPPAPPAEQPARRGSPF